MKPRVGLLSLLIGLTHLAFGNSINPVASIAKEQTAIRSGIYLHTLSNKESIGLCLYDLAKGYESQTKKYSDGFIVWCCDAVLSHQPTNVNALILKAEALKNCRANAPPSES